MMDAPDPIADYEGYCLWCELNPCRTCEGTGEVYDGRVCGSCGGTGIEYDTFVEDADAEREG